MRDGQRDAQHSIAVPLGALPVAASNPEFPQTPGEPVRTGTVGTTTAHCRDARGPADRLGRPIAHVPHTHPVAVAPPVDGAPLTPEQAAFLTAHLLAPEDDPSAHCVLAWMVHGPLDLDALEAAVADVHRRHDALCSAYLYDPEPVARPADAPAPAVEVLASVPDLGSALTTVREAAEDPMALSEGEVWRVCLVHVTDERWVIGCAVHGVAFGARTESVLAEDLAQAYNARSAALLPS
ncbi:condensation domain-containing protein [Streptomyces sp. NPDC056061]|uniref:condensation domain-containing protein n=1 Tax=Streptomyces sp. NPDC056061 TaxID=3345700 RepID=UPI0035DE3DD7